MGVAYISRMRGCCAFPRIRRLVLRLRLPLEMPPRAENGARESSGHDRKLSGKAGECWLEVATEMINNHLQLFRTLPWVMGGVGMLLIVKYSRLFTRYRTVSDIPAHLITRGTTLRGVAVGVWPDGHIDLWHTPLGHRLLNHRPPSPCPPDQSLGVKLAALRLKQPQKVCEWIRSSLIGRSVRLEPLHLSPNDQCLHCIVHYRKGYSFRLKCANTELLSLGLASLEEPGCHGNSHLHNNEKLIAFLSEGVRAESGAQRRGVGVWRGSVHEARWQRAMRLLRLRK